MARLIRYNAIVSAWHVNRHVLLASSKSSLHISSQDKTTPQTPSPAEIKNDMIGPPNRLSNLRPVSFHIPHTESELEKQFRCEREKVQKWNEDFWIQHNSAFFKEGNEFQSKRLGSSADKEKKTLSAEEMSEFYKEFLDKNWRAHVSYNFEWYRKNFYLLYLAFKVQVFKKVRHSK